MQYEDSWSRVVSTVVKNQFALLGGENAQLQTSRRAAEKPVVLNEFDRTAVGEPRHLGAHRIGVFYPRFDFDITSHCGALRYRFCRHSNAHKRSSSATTAGGGAPINDARRCWTIFPYTTLCVGE